MEAIGEIVFTTEDTEAVSNSVLICLRARLQLPSKAVVDIRLQPLELEAQVLKPNLK